MAGKENHDNQISAREQFEIFSRNNLHEAFTEEQLLEKWAELLVTLADRPNLRSTLNRKPILTGDSVLLLRLDNLVQEELIRNNKPQLIAWLRKELRNSKIEVITEISQEPVKRIIYTDDEKLDEMLRKNPVLSLLKERFQLDFDQ
jgi:hypothetical protein